VEDLPDHLVIEDESLEASGSVGGAARLPPIPILP